MDPERVAGEAIDRRPFTVGEEIVLALLPTATMLIVLVIVERLAEQRLLFASLASSAFLIYVDPGHTVNRVRTLIMAPRRRSGSRSTSSSAPATVRRR